MKALTREQGAARKEQAVRFVRDVQGDPDRADEIAEESLKNYAERRDFQITNPGKEGRTRIARTKADLEQEIADLREENEELQDQFDAIADIAGGEPEEDEEEDDYDYEDEENEEDEDRD